MNILELFGYPDYANFFAYNYFKTNVIKKLESQNIKTMKDLHQNDFSFYYHLLTPEELEELIFVLCNY